MLRDWGAEQKYHHVLKGYNYRMEGIQGAVLRVKMRHLEKWTEARRAAARYYDQAFAGSGIETPQWSDASRHVYHVYAIRSPERARWQQELTDKRRPDRHPLPDPCSPAAGLCGRKVARGDFPHSEKASKEVLSLPMYPELTRVQQDEVVAARAGYGKAIWFHSRFKP